MKKRKGLKILSIFALTVLGVGLFWAQTAKAVIPPRALRLFRIFNFSTPTDLYPQIIKTTYPDSGRGSREMSFEKGEKVYAKIEIFEPNASGQKMKIKDRVFNFKAGSFKNFSYTKSGSPVASISPTIDEAHNEMNFSIETASGVNKIEYEYEAGD